MRFLSLIVVFCASTTVFALTPKQYCEALEAKTPGSYEILNANISTIPGAGNGIVTVTILKTCHLGKFCISTSSDQRILNCGKTWISPYIDEYNYCPQVAQIGQQICN